MCFLRIMQALNEDEIFTGELHRLVAENTHLRQVAWRLAIDMRQLELLLRGPNDEEFEAEAEVYDAVILITVLYFFPLKVKEKMTFVVKQMILKC